MDTEIENASRDDLLRVIAQQETIIAELQGENALLRAENAELRELVAQLQQRVAELEAKLGPPGGKAVPDFVKPNSRKPKKEDPRKKRGQNFARKREEPT